jgi:hypothetical protein
MSSTHTSEDPPSEAEIRQDTDENSAPVEGFATSSQDTATPSAAGLPTHPRRGSFRHFLERLIHLGVPKSPHDLSLIKRDPHALYLDHPSVASRTALGSLLLFYSSTVLLLFIGIGWNFDEISPGPLIAWIVYIFYSIGTTTKRVCNQMYFVLEEVDAKKRGVGSSRSSTASIIRHGSSAAGSSISLATMRSLPVNLGQGGLSLMRQGTEADMGLVPPARRQTYPQRQE